ncbi:MAG TPA: hypothetical protein VN084_01010 [Methylophilaceae bacterium]|nr:hypothetical protein [Methylophilaceae bacterium]
MKTFLSLVMLCILVSQAALADDSPAPADAAPIQATTANGDAVILHPNGRWEFIDTKKAAEAKVVADQFPENQVCPPGAQGKFLGIGRCIPVGDKDFNRGSLSGKGR